MMDMVFAVDITVFVVDRNVAIDMMLVVNCAEGVCGVPTLLYILLDKRLCT